jgi:hypothetical protein
MHPGATVSGKTTIRYSIAGCLVVSPVLSLECMWGLSAIVNIVANENGALSAAMSLLC